ncbi:MAG: Jag N-terminal domain-containing protein [Candidatus Omnitrophica bacterium]|nr:Jag N-terminal domain-containing protein [Candidatus Omnitrophota bacterium]
MLIKIIDVSGATVKDAIKKALKKLSVTRSQVEVKVLAEGNKGLFGMNGSRRAKVRVTLKEHSGQCST